MVSFRYIEWEKVRHGVYRQPLSPIEAERLDCCKPYYDRGLDQSTIVAHVMIYRRPKATAEETASIIKKAWLALRFEFPTLACELDRDGSAKVYQVPTQVELDAWLRDTFQVSSANCANTFTGLLKYSRFPRLYFLEKCSQILLQVHYWRTDGRGALIMLNVLCKLMMSLGDGERLEWGTEVKNLRPSFLGRGAQTFAEDEQSRKVRLNPISSIAMDGDGCKIPSATSSYGRAFDMPTTELIAARCRDLGTRPHVAVQVASMMALYNSAIKVGWRNSDLVVTPIDLRARMPRGPWCSAEGAAAGMPLETSRFAAVTPLDDHMKLLSAGNMSCKDVLESLIKEIRAFEIGDILSDISEHAAMSALLTRSLARQKGLQSSSVVVNDLGNLNDYVSLHVERTAEGPAKLHSLVIDGAGLTQQEHGPGLKVHMWMENRCLRLHAAYNSAFHNGPSVFDYLGLLDSYLMMGLGLPDRRRGSG